MPFQTTHPDATSSLSLLEEAISSSTCGITIADFRLPDLPLIYINRAFERLTGYSAEETLGRNCRFLQGDQPNGEVKKQIHDAFASGTEVRVVVKNFRKDGTPFWNELLLSPLKTGDGTITHYVGIQNDVTARVEGKAQLRAKQKQLEQANARLETLMEEKDRLVGVVAHDLRGPVGSIRNFIELSLDAEWEEGEEMLHIAKDQAERCLRLINDLLDWSAVKAGRILLDKEPVNLDAFLDAYERHATLLAGPKEIRFEIRKDLKVTEALLDPDRIEQVLDNLLTNAIKFSKQQDRIVLEAATEVDYLRFRLIDEGPGIPEAELSAVFDAFRQTETRPASGEKGTGLGLFIVKRLVDLHGGTVSVESREGAGTKFTVTLPL